MVFLKFDYLGSTFYIAPVIALKGLCTVPFNVDIHVIWSFLVIAMAKLSQVEQRYLQFLYLAILFFQSLINPGIDRGPPLNTFRIVETHKTQILPYSNIQIQVCFPIVDKLLESIRTGFDIDASPALGVQVQSVGDGEGIIPTNINKISITDIVEQFEKFYRFIQLVVFYEDVIRTTSGLDAKEGHKKDFHNFNHFQLMNIYFKVNNWVSCIICYSLSDYNFEIMSRMSIVRSDRSKKQLGIHQTKSQTFDQQAIPLKNTAEWYDRKCAQIVNRLPMSIPTQKNSEPYRLVIDRISNFSQNKKSSSTLPYLAVMACFVTTELELIGKTCHYQCQLPLNSDGRLSQPIAFFYHSRVDRTYGYVKMLLKFVLKEYRDGLVDSSTDIGTGIISSPFTEQQVKNAPTYKECSQSQLLTQILEKPSPTQTTFSYTIQSKLQFKNLIKFIPGQTIVSTQDHISGISGSFLPQERDDVVEDEELVFVNLRLCQVHVPDKFEEQVLATVKAMNPASSKVDMVTSRKIVCGFHNEYQLVLPVTRTLDLIGKQPTGEYTVFVYEALGDNEIVKIPYFINNKSGPSSTSSSLAVSLIFVVGQSEYQVAIFATNPVLTGSTEEISVNMVTGSGEGFVSNLLNVKSTRNPTIIIEYDSQENIRVKDRIDDDRKQSQKRIERSKKNIKQSAKYIEQLQRQRLNLQKQKQELDNLRSKNYINYQDQFQKKLLEQREQLRLRQQMIENQYRQEVQKEIRQKLELENQIRIMKEKIAAIEQGQKNDMQSRKVSYNQTPAEFDPNYTSGFQQQQGFPPIRQKVNPNYLLDQQKTIPLNQVRDLMAKTFQQNKQTLQKQVKQFNCASKFTFMFSSIIWSPQINPPKSFYLVIKFFNFPEYSTDPITYIDTGNQYHQLIRVTHYTYNLENSTPSYQFIVDPSQYANPELLQSDLVSYLAKNNTIVDIFDAENYLYIGQINIKMGDLFRGSKNQVMIAKQFNLIRLKGQENYGVIQVLIKNQMIQCKDEISLLEKKTVKQIKKKVVSNNPILLTKQIYSEKTAVSMIGSKNLQHARNRQQKRIEMYKKKVAQSKKKGTFDQIQPSEKAHAIQKIHQYKQKKMPQFIRKVYEDLLTDKITINPYFGQTKTFVYQFTNMSQSSSSFRVSFQGCEEELNLVKDSNQWKYFVSQNRYPAPKIYDCINDENSFYLSPGETIPLVFRYLSFCHNKPGQHKSSTVTITKQQNNWITGGFTLQITPHESIINHSYILYQPGHQVIDMIIPVIFSSNDTRTPKRLSLTVEDASAEWINEYEIMLRVATPQIMSLLKFNMLLYEDDYFCFLRENWLVELYAYEGVYAVAKPDEKTRFKISLPEQVLLQAKPARIQFFTSHPDLVFQDQVVEGARLSRGCIEIWCQLLPGNTSLGSIQITCINEKKQLLYGWIVQVYPYSAKIN